MNSKLNTIMCIGIYTVCACVLCLIWQQTKSAKPIWEYESFKWDGKLTRTEVAADKTEIEMRLKFSYVDYSAKSNSPKTGYADVPIFEVIDVLNLAGQDGWEMGLVNGDSFIMKRHKGRWNHESFVVRYLSDSPKK